MTPERQVLWLPVVAGTLLTANAVVGAVTTRSQAVLADAVFSAFYVLAGLLTLRVATLIERPASERYPFGHAAFEPLANVLKGAVTLGLLAYVVWESAALIRRGGQPLAFGRVVVFTLVSTGISLAAAGFACWRSRRVDTPLVRGEVIGWALDAAAMLGVTASLGAAWLLDRHGHAAAARYVDPVVAIAVVLFLAHMPYGLARASLFELLGRAPARAERAALERAARDALAGAPVGDVRVRAVRVGRWWQVLVTATLDPRDGAAAGFTVREADAHRRRVVERLCDLGGDARARAEVVFAFPGAPTGANRAAHPAAAGDG